MCFVTPDLLRADQQQARDVSDDLTARRRGSRGEGRGRDSEEQVELLDQIAKRHDGDRRAHPGKKRPLIRRVAAIPLDHRATRPKGCRSERRADRAERIPPQMAPNETVTVTLISLLNAANLQPGDRRKPWKCSRSANAGEAITAKNS
jgi:hypothetical protein